MIFMNERRRRRPLKMRADGMTQACSFVQIEKTHTRSCERCLNYMNVEYEICLCRVRYTTRGVEMRDRSEIDSIGNLCFVFIRSQ